MWSNERENRVTRNAVSMSILCQTISPTLATMPGSKEIFSKYIASKSNDPEKLKEELELFDATEAERQATTRFYRGVMFQDPTNPNPYKFYDRSNQAIEPVPTGAVPVIVNMMMDYQLGGFFKEKISMLQRATEKTSKSAKKTKEEAQQEEFIKDAASDFRAALKKERFACSDIKAYKKTVDGLIKIKERKIPLIFPETFWDDEAGTDMPSVDPNGLPWVYQRSLRAQTMQGERVTLASSEVAPIGTCWSATIVLLDPALVPVVEECLDFGQFVGMLQNRGNGFGRFIWTPIDATTGKIV